ncbi:hypothetical protein [Streptomyces sp. IMTB 2501]|uniref:hypothetical protein n=1 Tax=Streptomyces sp. IMTB 2501 TaxID=1776340 RepID=UPI0015B9675A|nr:hypothetical protein [Streptomyces sp. IMTB 2501]
MNTRGTAQSGARAAGYCGLEHPRGGASCTRSPHDDKWRVDYYNDRKSVTDASGTEWFE